MLHSTGSHIHYQISALLLMHKPLELVSHLISDLYITVIIEIYHLPVLSAWEPFRDFIPEEERDNFILAYNKRLNSDDLDVQVY